MNKLMFRNLSLAVALQIVAYPTYADASPCGNGTPLRDAGEYYKEVVAQLGGHSMAVSPLTIPSAKESSATAGSKAGDDVVKGAGLLRLAGLALGSDMVKSNADTGSVTLTVNPFAVLALHDQSVVADQSQYERYDFLRRFNGAASFFGQAQAIDQDGDGKIDEARSAKNFDDVISFELRYRLHGDRDRRSKKNQDLFRLNTTDATNAQVAQVNKLLLAMKLRAHFEEIAPNGPDPLACGGSESVITATEWLKQTQGGADKVLAQLGGVDAYAKAVADVIDQIDNALLITAVAGGTARKAGFGGDEYMLGVRASAGYGGNNFNGNIEYTNVNGVGGLRDLNKYKLGTEVERQFDMVPGGTTSVLSLGVAYEFIDGTPRQANDETAKVSVSWKMPVTTSVSAVASVTWANNTELLDGHDDVIGHLGLSYDFENMVDTMMGKAQ